MKKLILFYALFFVSLSSYANATSSNNVSKSQEKHTFVIVHGATGGGWDWKVVAQHLSDNGHTVYRPTLSGLGEKYHLASKSINLTTHIQDIVNTILFEDLHDIVLVGHSYGGMVITGVMDQLPFRIKHVTFLDAMVPDDGMSMMDVRPISRKHKVVNGQVYFPWVDETKPFPRDVTHPLHSLTEAVTYNNPKAKKLNVTYVAFVPVGVKVTERAKDPSWHRAKQRNWTIRTFAGNHVVYRKKPIEFTAMLEATVNDRNTQ